MTATGKATVRIDDAALKARVRDLLAQAWEEGYADAVAGDTCRCHGNPYRDEADE